MTNELTIVTVAGDPDREAAFSTELATEPKAHLLLRCVDRTELIAAMRAGGVDGVVLVGLPRWLDPQTTYEIVNAGASLVGLIDDEAEATRIQRLGGVTLPSISGPREVIAAASEQMQSPVAVTAPPNGDRGRLVAVWGPKGSPGRTTLAIELSATLALADPSTLLIDGDPYGGDVVQLLGLAVDLPSILWAARMAEKGELDPGALLLELRRAGRRGPVLLPGLPRAELWAEISEFGWRALLDVARSTFDFVVCDVGFCLEPDAPSYSGVSAGRNALARMTVSEADAVIAVCRTDPVGVRSFLWAFDGLTELVDPERVTVVLNRARSGPAREARALIDRHIGKRARAVIPDRPTELRRAVAEGRPLMAHRAPRDVVDPLRDVAGALGAEVPTSGVMTRLVRGRS